MATTVVMPQLGESVTEGTVSKWLKQVGDWVDKYESLVEVITDKVNVEIPSPVTGHLREILVPEGMTVAVGETLAVIEEAVEAPLPEAAPEQPAVVAATAAEAPGDVAPQVRARATPRVRRLARELGVDLVAVSGSGPGNRITEEDVRSFAARAAPAGEGVAAAPPHPLVPEEEEVIPVGPVRKTIAERMVQSKRTAPHAWLMVEVDVTPLVRLRESIKEEFSRRYGADLTYLAFVVKAVAETLREQPILNSTWAEDKIVIKKRLNIGIAVALDDGLIVPVIHDADRKSIADLARAIADLTARARAGKLTLADVQGGTFTVNNPGAFGSLISMPIIHQGQAAILTMEAIVRRPLVIDDAIAIRSVMNLCLSFDHRILDGAVAGRFLRGVKERLESFGPDTHIL
ncbi:MAG: dihydrolipoamide acetyltransferase family protein [Chloroflexota bacterium]|nr:dihydrolipoamide acetyltransferase family protein [Chloroflexota bacterium]